MGNGIGVSEMEMRLTRKEYTEISTIGDLGVDRRFECYTLEDRVRPPGGKVFGKTAVPPGRYEVVIDWSNRFQGMMPHILNVPMFEGVRIHAGNAAENTEGCVLVGLGKEKDYIRESRIAFNRLFAKMETAKGAGERIFLEIVDGG